MTDSKTHWENIYKNNMPQAVSWYQNEPAVSLQLIRNTGLSLNEPIIDVGGGASTLVDCLCAAGYAHVAVLDISSNALTSARQRLGNKADSIEWVEEDILQFNPPHSFSIWHDRAVFHFLTEQSDRERYVQVLKRVLNRNGQVIIAAFAIDGPTRCSGLDIVQYDAEKLKAELGDGFELVEEKTEVHMTPSDKQQQFGYFRFIKK